MEVRFEALHRTEGNFDCLSGIQKAAIVLEDLMTEWRSLMGNGQGGLWCQPRLAVASNDTGLTMGFSP